MTPAEADARFAARKAVVLPGLLALSRDEKVALIKGAASYRSGSDSCNSLYMGSIATSRLLHVLGGVYGQDGLESLLERATESQVNAGIDYAWNYIDYMQKHPMKPCPCCGQIVPDRGPPPVPEDVWTAPVGMIVDAGGEKWVRLDETTAVRISALVRGEATQ